MPTSWRYTRIMVCGLIDAVAELQNTGNWRCWISIAITNLNQSFALVLFYTPFMEPHNNHAHDILMLSNHYVLFILHCFPINAWFLDSLTISHERVMLQTAYQIISFYTLSHFNLSAAVCAIFATTSQLWHFPSSMAPILNTFLIIHSKSLGITSPLKFTYDLHVSGMDERRSVL